MSLSPYGGPWDRHAASHMIYRAGFGASLAQIEALVAAGFERSLQSLLDFQSVPDNGTKPEWAKPVPDLQLMVRGATDEQKKAFQKERRQEAENLRSWWIKRMVATTRPLQEKLALFWHGHFATSLQKVKLPYFMWLQNETFRRNALGNWRVFLKEMNRDPAMLIYLDGRNSRSQGPNENYARELMELFTLGEGHYTEDDIKQAARAFTGNSIDPNTQSFVFRKMWHDRGTKTFFRRHGNFDGDEIIDIILEQPQAAFFICKKLWEFFVYDNPSDAIVGELADDLRRANYEFRPVLEKMFRSEDFFSSRSIKRQVKSPVQWMVGTLIALEAETPPDKMMLGALLLLGQDLFAPPNVKGWDGGVAWITTASLLNRYNLANAIVNGELPDEFLPNRKGNAKLAKKNANAVGSGTPMSPEMMEEQEAMMEERRERGREHLRQRIGKELQKIVDPKKIADPARFAEPGALIDHLCDVLYLDGIGERDRGVVRDYLGGAVDEEKVRGAMHLLMSTPHYQLC